MGVALIERQIHLCVWKELFAQTAIFTLQSSIENALIMAMRYKVWNIGCNRFSRANELQLGNTVFPFLDELYCADHFAQHNKSPPHTAATHQL